jgi:hypothetical protein
MECMTFSRLALPTICYSEALCVVLTLPTSLLTSKAPISSAGTYLSETDIQHDSSGLMRNGVYSIAGNTEVSTLKDDFRRVQSLGDK